MRGMGGNGRGMRESEGKIQVEASVQKENVA